MIDIGRGVKLIRRSEWRARAPRSVTAVNATFGTTAHWEGPHMGYPWAHAACFSLVRGIQNFHMDTRGWTDIAYSGLPCPHGYVFEGRWAGRRTAANGTNDGNNRALALCYLGGQGDAFTVDGQRGMRAAMDWLDAHGGTGPGRNGHRDWKPTECPGNTIYQWVHSGQQAGGAPTPEEDDDMGAVEQQQLAALTEMMRRHVILTRDVIHPLVKEVRQQVRDDIQQANVVAGVDAAMSPDRPPGSGARSGGRQLATLGVQDSDLAERLDALDAMVRDLTGDVES